MKTWSVPFITETTDIFVVEAANKTSATWLAEQKRAAGEKPTASHRTKFALGTVANVASVAAVAGADEQVEDGDQP